MDEAAFGKQYFGVFATAGDITATNILTVCRKENINDEVAARIIAAARVSIEQTATNTYSSTWGVVQKFFRK